MPSSKQRNTCIIALVALILPKNWFPKPSPLEAPLTKPAISTISIVFGCTLLGLTNSESLVNLSSGTVITPILGSIVQKGKLAACAFAFDKQLNKVDLPTLGTVSYTHLDVYKRQAVKWSKKSPCIPPTRRR